MRCVGWYGGGGTSSRSGGWDCPKGIEADSDGWAGEWAIAGVHGAEAGVGVADEWGAPGGGGAAVGVPAGDGVALRAEGAGAGARCSRGGGGGMRHWWSGRPTGSGVGRPLRAEAIYGPVVLIGLWLFRDWIVL